MITRLERTLKDFAKTMEAEQLAYAEKEKFVKANYAGEYLKSQMQQLRESHNTTMEDEKNKCQKVVNEILTQLRSKIDNMASQTDIEALNKLNALRGIKLSAAELESLAKANAGDYMAMRLLASIAADNGLHMRYTSLDDLKEAAAEVESFSMDFIKLYTGDTKNATYRQMCVIIQPHPFESVQQLFDSSEISITQKPREYTEEQRTTVKTLFDGFKDLSARAKELTSLGMNGTELLTTYYETMTE